MKELTAIILEDELIAQKRLIRILKEVAPEITVIRTFEEIAELDGFLKKNAHPDILFLDIQVADGNSFELFNLIEIKSKIIFITAYDEFAIMALRKSALDYILKPIKKEILKEAIEKVHQSFENNATSPFKERILVKFGAKIHSLPTEDIAYIHSKNKISYFYTFNGHKYPSDYILSKLEELLNPQEFYRANRQFIINIASIDTLLRHDASRIKVKLNPAIDEDIVISTEKSRDFKNWLKER